MEVKCQADLNESLGANVRRLQEFQVENNKIAKKFLPFQESVFKIFLLFKIFFYIVKDVQPNN